jgi:DNA-binding MarR family transcriptional regulator
VFNFTTKERRMNNTAMSRAFENWVMPGASPEDIGFWEYMHNVAQARYVVRKIVRIVHEQAKRAGLDPLEHQALVQLFADDTGLSVSQLAERLDVASAVGSRLIKALDSKGLVVRKQSSKDKRIMHVIVTDAGTALLIEIDRAVHVHIEYFQKQLDHRDRLSLMAVFAFWAGLESDSEIGGSIRSAMARCAIHDAEISAPRGSRR